MERSWFEMREIRRRRTDAAVWIPLRTSETISKIGEYGYAGYQCEFYGVGTLAVPLEKREVADQLRWHEIGLSNEQGIWASPENYKPADIYQYHTGEDLGLELVLVQGFGGAEPREWHLHMDLVFALGLKREDDNWVRPLEDYIVVARMRRNSKKEPVSIEIRNEYLRDYLCARKHILKISSYRSRNVIVADATQLSIAPEFCESKNGERFELRCYPIIEGGDLAGAFSVFRVARTDIDIDEDVPVPGPENDGNIESESWTGRVDGERLYRIQGELWRDEIIEPLSSSPRVRRDQTPTGISYIVDATGVRMSSEELNNQDNARWLWFSPSVVLELLRHRGSTFEWYTRDTGGISCGPVTPTHFGLNDIGLITTYAYDIAKLDAWQQRVWAGYNIAPEGGVSKELMSAQMHTKVASTMAPERMFGDLLVRIDHLFSKAAGAPLFRATHPLGDISNTITRFRALEPGGVFALAKEITKCFIERIDTAPLQKIAPPPPKENWGSLKSLEKYLATLIGDEKARLLTGPLAGVYQLRIADAHISSNNHGDAFSLVGIDTTQPPFDQGFQLIESIAKAIWHIGDAVNKTLPTS